jgi:two-component system KDP operon response regulator KdpE
MGKSLLHEILLGQDEVLINGILTAPIQWQKEMGLLTDPNVNLDPIMNVYQNGLVLGGAANTHYTLPRESRSVLVQMRDRSLRWRTVSALRIFGFEAKGSTSNDETLEGMQVMHPRVVVIDNPTLSSQVPLLLMRIRQIVEWNRTRVIIVNPGATEDEVVASFRAGADDYMTDPWPSLRELVARIGRFYRVDSDFQLVGDGNINIDLAAKRLEIGGVEVKLNAIQINMLALLIREKNSVVHLSQVKQLLSESRFTGRVDSRFYIVQMKIIRSALRPFGLASRVQGRRGEGYVYIN